MPIGAGRAPVAAAAPLYGMAPAAALTVYCPWLAYSGGRGDTMHVSRGGHDAGFTLVELMTVVAIVGILISVAVASFSISVDRSRRVTCVSNQRLIDNALMEYQITHSARWPDDLDEVHVFVKWSGTAYATCASDPAVAFTYDPATGTVECPNHPR